jgi:hypothetical protein
LILEFSFVDLVLSLDLLTVRRTSAVRTTPLTYTPTHPMYIRTLNVSPPSAFLRVSRGLSQCASRWVGGLWVLRYGGMYSVRDRYYIGCADERGLTSYGGDGWDCGTGEWEGVGGRKPERCCGRESSWVAAWGWTGRGLRGGAGVAAVGLAGGHGYRYYALARLCSRVEYGVEGGTSG